MEDVISPGGFEIPSDIDFPSTPGMKTTRQFICGLVCFWVTDWLLIEIQYMTYDIIHVLGISP